MGATNTSGTFKKSLGELCGATRARRPLHPLAAALGALAGSTSPEQHDCSCAEHLALPRGAPAAPCRRRPPAFVRAPPLKRPSA